MSIGRRVVSCGFWLLATGSAALLVGCSGGSDGQPTVPPAQVPATVGASASIPGALPVSTPSSAAPPATTVAPPATPVATPASSAASGSSAGGTAYFRYENKRFKFAFYVPDGYKAATPPVDGDGQEFDSADGSASVTGSGVNNLGANPGTSLLTPAADLAALSSHYRANGDTVTYQAVDGDIVAVSGTTPQGKIFYQRDVVYSQVLYALVWSYPAAEKARFDAIISHTAGAFVPGPDQAA